MEPTLGVTVGFLSSEVCEQRSDIPNRAAWGLSTLLGPKALETFAASEQRNLSPETERAGPSGPDAW